MAQPTSTPSRPPTNLPEPVSELIGRDVELDEILDLSTSHRLVTLVGPGGIGKTRLSSEVARHLLPRFVDGVWVAELAPLSDPELVSAAVATTLGLDLAGGPVSPERVANGLGSKQLMLVLDNCEHVADAVAEMAEALLRANPGTRVIATSREPLRVEGEWIYPVPPLAVPAEGSPDGEDPLRYGAVRLFVERVRAATPHFSPDAGAGTAIAGICRRLDGIPLAIELAASRAATLGIEELAARLDHRFELLTGGRRTALPRQRTLRATLDWSYELLPEAERAVLRRLAIFSGGFGLEAANAITATTEGGALDVVDSLANLVAKSLVTRAVGSVPVRYRLLDTMRAYGLEKLTESSEFEIAVRRHAEYFRDLFERAEPEPAMRPTAEWIATYGQRINDVRAALDWAFSPGGDTTIGVALTIASEPLWSGLSLMDEWRRRVEAALASIRPGAGGSFEGALLIKRGDVAAGVGRLRTGLDELREASYVLRSPGLLGKLSEGLARIGQVAEGLAAIDDALAQCERTDERWNMAELLRVKGELLLREGAPEAKVAAEHHYQLGLEWARRQGALFWELRCATTLARLWRDQARSGEARKLLAPVYDRFTEGFATADLKAAKALLDDLS